jgi:hypothetical protein
MAHLADITGFEFDNFAGWRGTGVKTKREQRNLAVLEDSLRLLAEHRKYTPPDLSPNSHPGMSRVSLLS